MDIIVDKTFRNQTVDLDGKRFARCQFFDCTLRWRGRMEFDLDDCNFFDIAVRCEEAAKGSTYDLFLLLMRNAKPVEEKDHGEHVD